MAGQYGPWSNIFQAALVSYTHTTPSSTLPPLTLAWPKQCMQNLITQATVPYPPVAIGPLNAPEGAHLFDSASRVRDSRGQPLPPFHTHGYNLASVPGLDEDFMHLLLRCLADLPDSRPSLWELNWVMVNKERSPGWAIPADDPDGVRAWCDRMFKEPPAVSAACHPSFCVLQCFDMCYSWLTVCRLSASHSPPRLRQTHPWPSRPRCRQLRHGSPRCQGTIEFLEFRVMMMTAMTTTMTESLSCLSLPRL